MMDYFYIFILGCIQGLTEFLPISSSGHLVLFKDIFNMFMDSRMEVEIFLHFGTMLSIIFYYRNIISDFFGNLLYSLNQQHNMLLLIILGCIPISITGIIYKDYIASSLWSIKILPYTYFFISIILFLSKYSNNNKEIGYKHACIIGIAQTLALLPGISRSGITIGIMLILGIKRKEAVDFSFLMAIPLILGASIIGIDYSIFDYSANNLFLILFGMLISFLFGLLALNVLTRLVLINKMWFFSIYCLLLSLITFFLGN